MNTEQHLQKLTALETSLQKMVTRQLELQQRVEGLRLENQDLHQTIQRQEETLRNFQNQENISKIVHSIATDTGDTTELKYKINEYIKELDRCIAHLKN
jgi:chromosome segregation ATPase